MTRPRADGFPPPRCLGVEGGDYPECRPGQPHGRDDDASWRVEDRHSDAEPLPLPPRRRAEQTRRKSLARPFRVERKGSKKCGLRLQNLERTYAPLPRQPNYNLLDPDRARRLREIGV